MVKASIAIAPGSFFHETYRLHLVLVLVANRSTSGLPNLLTIVLKALFDNLYSVSGSNRRDSKSASTFSSEQM